MQGHSAWWFAWRRIVARIVAVAMALALAAPAFLQAANVYVAPDGDDNADGRPGRPVATLRRALDLVREIRGVGVAAVPVIVEVADGHYELDTTLVVDQEDSGTADSPTIVRAAAGARPVFSGGRRIAGWEVSEVDGRPRWTAVIPEAKRGRWRFAQVFVDGQRRFRPSLPADGWFTILRALEPSPDAAGKGHDRFVASAGDMLREWSDREALEVVVAHRGTTSRMHLADVEAADGDAATVVLSGHTSSEGPSGALPAGGRYRLENVREALGEPGSWYLDEGDGVLTYCPRDGEAPEATELIVPRLDTLLAFRGGAVDAKRLASVRFEGLSFAHSSWALGARGQSFPSGDLNVGAAVTMSAVRDVALVRCGIRHVGRYGVVMGLGTRDCRLEGCELVDLGAGGVIVGTASPPADRFTAVSGNVIRDCTIRAAGRLHPAGIGVWIGHAERTTVERCEIADVAATGIAVGGTRGYARSDSGGHVVRGNLVHHVGASVLADVAGIATSGAAPAVVIEGNLVHDVAGHDSGGVGLVADDGSSGVVFRGNVVHRTVAGAFRHVAGRDNVVEKNIFATGRLRQFTRDTVEDHTSLRFDRNVVWWSGDGDLAAGDWSKRIVVRNNLYWHDGGAVVFPGGGDLAARQAAGLDRGSRVADPRFGDAAAGDFSLPPDSPAIAVGFQPIDMSVIGRITEPSLAPSLPAVPSPWPGPTLFGP